MNGQSERIVHTLEDMLRACVLDFSDSWDRLVKLMEFLYNNSYHSGISMAPFEALYGRKGRLLLYWDEVGEKLIIGPDVRKRTLERIKIIQERLKVAQDRNKSWADLRRRPLEFQMREKVYLKVSPHQGSDEIWKK